MAVGWDTEPVQSTEARRLDSETVAALDQVQTAAVRHAQAARQDGTVARCGRAEERHYRHGNYYSRPP